MGQQIVKGFVVECLLPDVDETDLAAIDARAAAVAERCGDSPGLAYLGSILIVEDEVILCLFEGTTVEAVRIVAEKAEIPFERVLSATCPSWSAVANLPAEAGGQRRRQRGGITPFRARD